MTPPFPTPVRAAYAIVVLTLLGFILTTDITLTALLIEPMKRDMALSDMQVALMQGTAYGLALGFASLPMGRLIDRRSRRMLLTIGIVAWTGALVVIATAPSLWVVLAGRLMLGIVAALVVPATFSLGADLYAPARRSRATSLLVVGQALGQGFGMFAGGKAFDALTRANIQPFGLAPWRVLYLMAAMLGVIVLVLLLGLREPVRQERKAEQGKLSVALSQIWQYREFLFPLIIGLLFAQVAIQAAAVWVSPLLIRRGLTPGMFAGWLSVILLFAGVLGALSGGWLAEVGRVRAGLTGALRPGALIALTMVPASLFAVAAPLPFFASLFALHVFSGAIVATIGIIAVTLVIPNDIRGLALGINTFAAAVFGAAGAPAGVALISDALGGENMLGVAVAALCVPSALLGAACLAAAGRAVLTNPR